MTIAPIVQSVTVSAPPERAFAIFTDSMGRWWQAGKTIGKVVDVEFITNRYPCSPETEDFGFQYQGRTDDCEPWMFCAPNGPNPHEGVCSELEEYSGRPSDCATVPVG